MNCSECGKELIEIEINDGAEMCMRCELKLLREYKRKEFEDMLKLIGSPVYEQVVNGKFYPGCKLNWI
jgi:DNA-directed RNA polymerase subunit RPC12/RpoP